MGGLGGFWGGLWGFECWIRRGFLLTPPSPHFSFILCCSQSQHHEVLSSSAQEQNMSNITNPFLSLFCFFPPIFFPIFCLIFFFFPHFFPYVFFPHFFLCGFFFSLFFLFFFSPFFPVYVFFFFLYFLSPKKHHF